ncbi:MAG TPA: tRNA (guanosine(37)-N1)-methyltransferase TrmD [Patescibacteria group bacterium]|nr:tRNA (guanosine(37)-N1)-methyltransferase TrmD [Patescibacteria group bacterium]
MRIDIITLFPEMFEGPFSESIIKRAVKKGVVGIDIHQLRKWTTDKHSTVDDRPYGGGPGMVMKIDVAYRALKQIAKIEKKNKDVCIILPTPKGKRFNQKLATKLAKKKHLVFICPHYEGYDHRIESLVDEKISIGDYILTGGELPAAVIVDSVVRLIPGAIKPESLKEETFSKENYIEYEQYTRPEIFEANVRGKKIKKRVPKVLLSGNHALIAKWRGKMSK